MKEVQKYATAEFSVKDPVTGKDFLVSGKHVEQTTYYRIRNITSRVNIMELLTATALICKSPKDIEILNYLLDDETESGRIFIDNVSNKAKDLGISRSKLNLILKRSVEEDLFKKLDRGTYAINPFIFIGRRVRSNKQREALQTAWDSLTTQ